MNKKCSNEKNVSILLFAWRVEVCPKKVLKTNCCSELQLANNLKRIYIDAPNWVVLQVDLPSGSAFFLESISQLDPPTVCDSIKAVGIVRLYFSLVLAKLNTLLRFLPYHPYQCLYLASAGQYS